MFRDEYYLQMMNTVAGENDFTTLTISHFKVCANAECNAFVNAAKKVVIEHHEEVHKNRFSQFTHDEETLKTRISIKLLACNLLTNSLNTTMC